MPIGTIIGWLIGAIIIALVINHKNGGDQSSRPMKIQLMQLHIINITSFIIWTSSLALIGTIIELIVR